MFTLDGQEIPISSAKADNNAVHINKGSAKKCYIFKKKEPCIAHSNGNGGCYINGRGSKAYTKVTVSGSFQTKMGVPYEQTQIFLNDSYS